MAVTFTSRLYFMNENTLSRDSYGMRQTSNDQTSSCQHPLSKRLVWGIKEVQPCEDRNTRYVPVFYRGNKTCVLVPVHGYRGSIS